MEAAHLLQIRRLIAVVRLGGKLLAKSCRVLLDLLNSQHDKIKDLCE